MIASRSYPTAGLVHPAAPISHPRTLRARIGVSPSARIIATSWPDCRIAFALARVFSAGNSSGSSAP